jgi:pyrroline-5-carboxylate reductase
MTARVRVGVVGVGTIAAALVEAVVTGPRGADVEVVLSPRSEHRAADLAARHESVRIAHDNQAVLDASDVVLLAVLPPQLVDVVAALEFRADHVVASLVAGWPPSLLGEHVAPASAVCQLIPLPMVALRTGPLVLYPEVPAVADLLTGCGDVVVLEKESDVLVLNCASAVMSTCFELQTTVVDWAAAKGLPRGTALDYVTALFEGLGAEGRAAPDLDAMALEHETPGGFNEQIRRELTAAGLFSVLETQLEHLHSTRRARRDG